MKYTVEYIRKEHRVIEADNLFDADEKARQQAPEGFIVNEYWRCYEQEKTTSGNSNDNRNGFEGNTIESKESQGTVQVQKPVLQRS